MWHADSLVPPSLGEEGRLIQTPQQHPSPTRALAAGTDPRLARLGSGTDGPGRPDPRRDARQAPCAASPTPAAPACLGPRSQLLTPLPAQGPPSPGMRRAPRSVCPPHAGGRALRGACARRQRGRPPRARSEAAAGPAGRGRSSNPRRDRGSGPAVQRPPPPPSARQPARPGRWPSLGCAGARRCPAA